MIELLVVIAIIAMLLPALSKAEEKLTGIKLYEQFEATHPRRSSA